MRKWEGRDWFAFFLGAGIGLSFLALGIATIVTALRGTL